MKKKLVEPNIDFASWSQYDLLSGATPTTKEVEGTIKMLPEFSGILKTLYLEPDIREISMQFGEISKFWFRNLINAHKEGKKIALENFNFPPAILYAMDVVPLMPEGITSVLSIMHPRGVYRFLDYCVDIGLPETMCTAQRGGVGAIFSGLMEKPDMVLNMASGSCDTNSKIFDFVSEYLHIPFCNIDAPPYYDEDGDMARYYRKEYRKMVSFLEEQTGNKLDEDKLRKVCEEVKKQDEYIAEIYELRKAVPNPLPAVCNLVLFGAKFLAVGTPVGTKTLKTVYEVTKERYKKGRGVLPEERVRAGFVYLSHFTRGGEFWRWMEGSGISLLMEGLSLFGHQHFRMDTSTVDTMLDGLADQASNRVMTKQIRGPYDYPGQWLEDIITLYKDLKLDCVIYLGTLGCKNTWGCIKVMMKAIEEEVGIPTLIIQSDTWDDRVTPWPSIRDQLEEFVGTVVLQ